jgi:hypothetical protein
MVAVLDYYTPGYVSSNEEATENAQGKQIQWSVHEVAKYIHIRYNVLLQFLFCYMEKCNSWQPFSPEGAV